MAPTDAASAALHSPWYRQPVIWVAIALFAASIAGCIAMIVIGARHGDDALPEVGEQVFKVPVSRVPAR